MCEAIENGAVKNIVGTEAHSKTDVDTISKKSVGRQHYISLSGLS